MIWFGQQRSWSGPRSGLMDEDGQGESEVIEQEQYSEGEIARLIANGTLTKEAWRAHLQGASWQIQVQR